MCVPCQQVSFWLQEGLVMLPSCMRETFTAVLPLKRCLESRRNTFELVQLVDDELGSHESGTPVQKEPSRLKSEPLVISKSGDMMASGPVGLKKAYSLVISRLAVGTANDLGNVPIW